MCGKTHTIISVRLPERFGIKPCTFGTQLNVFSRESSSFLSGPNGLQKSIFGMKLSVAIISLSDQKSSMRTFFEKFAGQCLPGKCALVEEIFVGTISHGEYQFAAGHHLRVAELGRDQVFTVEGS